MIDTQLILVEGPPGSGKSTTAQKLAGEIAAAGFPCQCFLEWSPDHPIPIGDDLHLDQVIASARARESDMLAHWRRFAQSRQSNGGITVLESRFWQTSVMLLYVAGLPAADVQASSSRVIQAIQGLNPVLIYLPVSDIRAFSARTIQIKEEEWRRSGLEGSWAGHLYSAFDQQEWFTARGLSGQTGMVALLEDWAEVAEGLYQSLPFPRLKIQDAYQDWDAAMQQIRAFLSI